MTGSNSAGGGLRGRKSLSGLLDGVGTERRHGLLFDVAVLLGNLLLIGVGSRNVDALPDALAGGLLCVALGSQMTGAWLKGPPLRRRLARAPQVARGGLADWFMKVLLLCHFLLFTVLTVMALVTLRAGEGQGGSDALVAIGVLVGAATTSLTWQAGRVGGPPGREVGDGVGRELAADFLLWISVSVVTHFLWGLWFDVLEPARGSGVGGRGLVLLTAMSVLFVAFYLPSRYLFLVEDRRSPWTWVQASAAMLPVAWLIIVG